MTYIRGLTVYKNTPYNILLISIKIFLILISVQSVWRPLWSEFFAWYTVTSVGIPGHYNTCGKTLVPMLLMCHLIPRGSGHLISNSSASANEMTLSCTKPLYHNNLVCYIFNFNHDHISLFTFLLYLHIQRIRELMISHWSCLPSHNCHWPPII